MLQCCLDYCCSLCYNTIYGIKNAEAKQVDRIIQSSVILIHIHKRCEHSLTDMHQHNMKWLPFKKWFEFRLPCLMHNTLILGRPGYLRGLLVRRQIFQHLRSSDATLLKLTNGCNAMQSRLSLELR